jgi:hypothetical protein
VPNPRRAGHAAQRGERVDVGVPRSACAPRAGFSALDDDCDDTAPDLGAPIERHPDADGDGYGDASSTVHTCDPSPRYRNGYGLRRCGS